METTGKTGTGLGGAACCRKTGPYRLRQELRYPSGKGQRTGKNGQKAGKTWRKDIIVHKIGEKTYSKSINDAYYQSLPIDNAVLQYNPQWGIAENNAPFEPYNAW